MARRKKDNDGPVMVESPFNQVDHEILKNAFLERAKQSEEEFPKLLDRILDAFRSAYPPHILATISSYGLVSYVSDEGVEERSGENPTQQHHVEILQAILLLLSETEWGHKPAEPDLIQSVIDDIAELCNLFAARRFSEIQDDEDEQRKTVKVLQENLRLHTQIVRNWGYFSEVVKISSELYSNLDREFSNHIGFSV